MSGKSLAFGYESHQLSVWSLEMVQRCYRGVGDIHMNRGRVGEDKGGKEMDRCPLTAWTNMSLVDVTVLWVGQSCLMK
jgi:hypothetical protein